ncbi:HD-GYP domain-containing protein [Piscinibacter sp.]|uniref:HD-GYP domain-containing protein n=1 Tax=Piscinibacter sp. TaxID=1903157 RepID=UPI00355A0B5C
MAQQWLNLPNPHALAAIIDASATRKIVASQDIVDDRGTKLWARDQPVSQSLQQRLLERKLKQPLEACLRAEDGVTTYQLCEALGEFLDSGHVLANAVGQWATPLRNEVQRLPLHAAAQLLLTAVHATRPTVYEHAIRGMALAGAMQASVGGERYDLRLALLGGLLHDLGLMYVHPQYVDHAGLLDAQDFRHVATHPRVGELLLASLTDYPPTLARAVGEHHERLDGSGYPLRRSGDAISPLGRLLCVAEATLGLAALPTAPLARASLALRMVPGEFDGVWTGFVSAAARNAAEQLRSNDAGDTEDLLVQLAMMNTEMAMALEQAQALAEQAHGSRVVHDVAARAAVALERLRAGWNSIGLWSAPKSDGNLDSRYEIGMAATELRYRMRGVQRECLWTHDELSPQDAERLAPLWACLAGQAA